MGATITTGKRAAAFKDAAGVIWYMLYEQTYESNCYPHAPEWSCTYFGTLEGAIEKVFKYGSSCEGGMLAGPGKRHIKPENYIAAWLRELSTPIEHQPADVMLQVSDSWRAPIETQNAEKAYAVLYRFGYDGIVDILKSGGTHALSMMHDAPAIAELFGNKSSVGPWRVIKHVPHESNPRDASLGYAPRRARKGASLELPQVLKISPVEEGLLVQQPDENWRYGGWAYSVMSGFICSIWEQELTNPGAYKTAITALREAIKQAPVVPAGTKVVVNEAIPCDSRYAKETVEKLPERIAVTRTQTGYEFDIPTTRELVWQALQLPEANTRWVLPQIAPQAQQAELELV